MNDDAVLDVFLSYSHEDSEFAHRLAKDLQEVGITIWRDSEQVKVGDYILDRINGAIQACALFVAVVSAHYKASTWCRHEVRLKLSEEVERGHILVLPIRLDETDPEELVPAKGWADFRVAEDYQQSFDNLRFSISYHLDPLRAQEKQKKLEDMLKRLYVDACYGTVPGKAALNTFHTAATMNPDSVFVWRALGYIYHYHFGDFEAAEKYYLRALELDPENAPVIQGIGLMYMHAKKEKPARKYLTRAKELGYTTAIEWKDYDAAGVRYTPGPYGLGGIPNLFGSVLNAADALLESSTAETLPREETEDS